MADDKYSKELNVAVRVVHMACSLCEKVQNQLLSTNSDQVKSKDDDSLVTVAGTPLVSSVSTLRFLNWVLFLSFRFRLCGFFNDQSRSLHCLFVPV